MAQFDVYRNKNSQSKSAYPYLVDVQSDLLSDLRTRVVVPVIKLAGVKKKSIKDLTPIVDIGGTKHLMLIPQLAGVSITELTQSIDNVRAHRDEIIAAVDFLMTGV